MIRIAFILLLVGGQALSVIAQSDLSGFFEKADVFFDANVKDNRVRYATIKKNAKALNNLLDLIAAASVEDVTEATEKAFYINAYNLLVIKGVVDAYPIKKPTEVSGFFDSKKYTVAGKKYTLNNLEKKELLGEYKDARLHFVLVCGAVSCPPIVNFAYTPQNVEEQLELRTKAAINDKSFIRYDDFVAKGEISQIFEWYKSDFKPSVRAFINKYRSIPIEKGAKLGYYNYNWQLNDVAITSEEATEDTLTPKKKAFEPIIVAATLPKGKFELNTFHTIFTANYGDKVWGSRSSYFTSLWMFSYGINGRFDVGTDVILKSFRANDNYKSSPFRALEFKQTADSVAKPDGVYRSVNRGFALSHLGPRVRIAPFKKLSLTFEQAFYFPITGLPANNTVDNALYWVTQVYFDHQFNKKFGAFAALTFWQPIVTGQKFKFQIPYLKLFFSWFATPRFTLYATTTSFTEWGAGAKFLITPQFEIQALYTYYAPIPKLTELYTGMGAKNVMTINIGLRLRI